MLDDGIADLAALGRQLIADPEWVNKARTGREEDIVPCLSCNNCINNSSMQAPIRCSVNPLAGREVDDNALTPASGNAVVIGAGPAGIEAALTLADKGCSVLLCDKAGELGGSLQLANKAPGKFRMDNLIAYYGVQLKKRRNITVRLGCEVTEATLDEFEKLNPKAVVLAAGGSPIVPKFPGAEKAVTANDVLSGRVDLSGKRVVVIGGGMTGIETAELLAAKGARPVICEMLAMLGAGSFILSTVKAQLGLARQGVAMKKSTLVTGIEDGKVLFKDLRTGLAGSLPADAVVLALGVKPDKRLLDALSALRHGPEPRRQQQGGQDLRRSFGRLPQDQKALSERMV